MGSLYSRQVRGKLGQDRGKVWYHHPDQLMLPLIVPIGLNFSGGLEANEVSRGRHRRGGVPR